MDLIGILIFLLIACIVLWAARAIMSAAGVGEPIFTVVNVVLVVLFLIEFIGRIGYGHSFVYIGR